MTQDTGAPAQWAEDPAGRHRYRYWDGTGWTQLVADDEAPPVLTPEPAFWTTPAPGPRPDPDAPPAAALPTVRVSRPDDGPGGSYRGGPPDRGGVPGETPLRTHAALTVATLGLWLLAIPGLRLWREHRREWAVLWAIGSTVLVVLAGVLVVGHVGGDGPTGRAAVTVPGADVAAAHAPAPTRGPTRSSPRAAGPVPAATTTTTRRARTTRSPRTTRPPRTPRTTASGPLPAGAPRPTTGATTRATTARPTSTGPDPRFVTCIQARADGYGPYRRGVDPEYAWYWDLDGNGVVCE